MKDFDVGYDEEEEQYYIKFYYKDEYIEDGDVYFKNIDLMHKLNNNIFVIFYIFMEQEVDMPEIKHLIP